MNGYGYGSLDKLNGWWRSGSLLVSRLLLFQSSFHGRHLLLEVIQVVDTILHHIVLVAHVLQDQRHLLQILVAVIRDHVHLGEVLQGLMHDLWVGLICQLAPLQALPAITHLVALGTPNNLTGHRSWKYPISHYSIDLFGVNINNSPKLFTFTPTRAHKRFFESSNKCRALELVAEAILFMV